MEKKERMTKLDFEKEIIFLAESSIGIKRETARKKAKKLFKKYDNLIEYSDEEKDLYKKRWHRAKIMFETLKSGVISYVHGKENEEINVSILLKDIEEIEKNNKGVVLTMKRGKKIILDESFWYLSELI